MTGNKLDILVICRDKEELEIVFEEILLQEQEDCGLDTMEFYRSKKFVYIKTPNVNYEFTIKENVRGKRVDQIIVNTYNLQNSEISKLCEKVKCALFDSCVPRKFQFIELGKLLEANKERYKKGEK